MDPTNNSFFLGESSRGFWCIGLVPVVILFGCWSVLPAGAVSEQLSQRYRVQVQQLERLTGRSLDGTFELKRQDSEGFRRYVNRQLGQMDQRYLERVQRRLARLGLLDRGQNLTEALTEVYQQQAGAYYDPRTQTIYVLESNLPGMGQDFLLFHELVHGYQDLQYDLESIRRQAWETNNLDRQVTFLFLIEGHANFLAYLNMMGHRQIDPDRLQSAMVRQTFSSLASMSRMSTRSMGMMSQLFQQSSGTSDPISNISTIVFRMLTDPYFVGPQAWLYRFYRTGDWETAETWLGKNRPGSTRAVLIGKSYQKPEVGRDQTLTMGLYFFLRWVDGFPMVPEWTRSLTGDVSWISDSGDLKWVLKFTDSKAASTAEERIRQQLDVSEDPAGRFEIEGRKRMIQFKQLGSRLRMTISYREEA